MTENSIENKLTSGRNSPPISKYQKEMKVPKSTEVPKSNESTKK